MSKMLRCSAAVLLVAALAACGSPEPMRDASPDARGDAGSMSMADAMVPVDTGVSPTDGSTMMMGDGGSMTCGAIYSPCNPVTNAGCAAGQMCVIIDSMTRMSVCVPAGRGAFGAACTSDDDCQEGLNCIGSKCTRWCCGLGDNGTCRGTPGGRPGAICNIEVEGTGLFACSLPDNCDVHQQNCMDAMQACVSIGADGTTQCVTPIAGATPGGACSALNGCPRGYICVSSMGGASTCRQICDPTNMSMGMFSTCPMGQTCSRINGQPMDVGACIAM